MRLSHPAGRSRRLAVLLLAVVAPPTVALVWLGLQLLEQDRSLLAQREREILQATADDAVRAIEQGLLTIERASDDLPPGVVRLRFFDDRLEPEPADGLLWLPAVRTLTPAETQPFLDAERQWEYRGEAARALQTYRTLTRSESPALRAGAWLRVARVHRGAARWDEALSAYRELADVGGVAIDGQPADLVARRAECAVLEAAGRTDALRECATTLTVDLLDGRWPLERWDWALAAGQLETWTGTPLPAEPEALAMSNAAAWLWDERRQGRLDTRAWIAHDGIALRATAPGEVLALGSSALDALLQSIPDAEQLGVIAADGRLLAGVASQDNRRVTRVPSETGLPWTITVAPANLTDVPPQLVIRQRLLWSGLVSLVLLLAGGGYFLWRVMRSELAVAQAQTEFVSAVSHEFRTPLATLRHVTELMQEDDEVEPEQRQSFYRSLERNTARLQRLVESLLSFGRIEAGTHAWHFENISVRDLVEHVVAESRATRAAHGREIHLETEDRLPPVRADREVLASALWNLVENAIKYSEPGTPVAVFARPATSGVEIGVRDQGHGIRPEDQRRIFRQFVRGGDAVRNGTRGVGIGLALVRTIAEGHGGMIRLDSVPGRGSTFTIVLPAAASDPEGAEQWAAS